jgi:hypothetical protein
VQTGLQEALGALECEFQELRQWHRLTCRNSDFRLAFVFAGTFGLLLSRFCIELSARESTFRWS